METAAYVALALIATPGIGATVQTIRSRLYNGKQLFWQLVLIWVIPILGSLLVLTVMQSQKPRARRGKSNTDHDLWENAQNNAHGVE